MQLRIHGGRERGRILASGPGLATRPTPAGIREALVNILRDRLAGAAVLDLYAGYGTVGLELLSAGAARAVLVERQAAAVRLLRENVGRCGCSDQVAVWALPVDTALDRLAAAGERFAVIFCDPPYDRDLAAPAVGRIVAAGLPASGGMIIVQHSRREVLPAAHETWRRTRERVSGDTVLSFYEEEPGG